MIKKNLKTQLNSIDTRLGSLVATTEENKTKITELKNRIQEYSDSNINDKYHELSELENRKKKVRLKSTN